MTLRWLPGSIIIGADATRDFAPHSGEEMRPIRSPAILAIGFSVFGLAIANADAMKSGGVACKDLANIKKIIELQKKDGPKGSFDFTQTKVAERSCIWIRQKGTAVVDMQEGPFSCIRPPGEFDCYWTNVSTDPHPGFQAVPPRSPLSVTLGGKIWRGPNNP